MCVKGGFVYMDVFRLSVVVWVDMSKKFKVLYFSISAVKFKFCSKVLKSLRIGWISVWQQYNDRRMSPA